MSSALTSVVLVDAYNRTSEKWCVKWWIEMYPDFILEEPYAYKGAAVLRRGMRREA